MRYDLRTLPLSLLFALGACGGLEQTGPGAEGKGDGFSDEPTVVFSCHDTGCEPQCRPTLETQAARPDATCVLAPHEGPGCTIACYDEPIEPPSSGRRTYGTVCETPNGSVCDHVPPAPINSRCECGYQNYGRIVR